MAMILIVKTKAYSKANLLHPAQKHILIAAEFFKYSAVFNNTGREKVESTTPARVPSQVFTRAYTSQHCSSNLENNTRRKKAVGMLLRFHRRTTY